MKVPTFTLSVLLLCLISYSVSQITFSRTWVRGKYPEGGGDDTADFHRETKSELYSPNNQVRRGGVKLFNFSPAEYLKYRIQQGENAQRLRFPIPYSQFSHTNYLRVK